MLELRNPMKFDFIQYRGQENFKEVRDFLIKRELIDPSYEDLERDHDNSFELEHGECNDDNFDPTRSVVHNGYYIVVLAENEERDYYMHFKKLYVVPPEVFHSEFVQK